MDQQLKNNTGVTLPDAVCRKDSSVLLVETDHTDLTVSLKRWCNVKCWGHCGYILMPFPSVFLGVSCRQWQTAFLHPWYFISNKIRALCYVCVFVCLITTTYFSQEVSGVGPRVRSSRVSSEGDGETGSVILGITDLLVSTIVPRTQNKTSKAMQTPTVGKRSSSLFR